MSEDSMPAVETSWSLNDDRKGVRLTLPPVRLAGVSEPLDVFVEFDTEAIEELISQLIELRGRMLPPSKTH